MESPGIPIFILTRQLDVMSVISTLSLWPRPTRCVYVLHSGINILFMGGGELLQNNKEDQVFFKVPAGEKYYCIE